jgi:predicted lipoprotein with Yx(FWY)xxD motif
MRLLAVFALVAVIVAVPAFAAPPPAKVLVRSTTVGQVLVDARGRTLYLRAVDKPRTSTCYGSCASAWPPFIAAGKPRAGSGVTRTLLGTAKRKDGRMQVTYAGHPLYFFAQDTAAGETLGQASGGIWWVVGASGRKITKTPTAPSTTTTAPSGGGYGGYGP